MLTVVFDAAPLITACKFEVQGVLMIDYLLPECCIVIAPYERQAALHRQKMSSPERFIQDWVRKSPRAQQGLLRHWQQDLIRHQELAGLIKEYALAAVAEREKQSDRAGQDFYDGYVQGFHRVVSLMQQQAQAFGIDLKDLQLEGVQPDRDLV